MIKVANLTKKYRNYICLNNINLTIPSKGIVCFVGANGSGKSTLLNIIGCYDLDYIGEVYFNDTLITKKNAEYFRSNKIGYIFQDDILFEDLSVEENLKKGVLFIPTKEEIENVLKEVDLLDLINQRASTLSFGERKRLNIARVLLKNPEVILADEITASLDKINSDKIYDILKRLSRTRLIILVLHNHKIINEITDMIYKFEKGQVINDKDIKNELITNIEIKKNNLFFSYFKYFIHSFGKKIYLFTGILLLCFIALISINSARFNEAKTLYRFCSKNQIPYLYASNSIEKYYENSDYLLLEVASDSLNPSEFKIDNKSAFYYNSFVLETDFSDYEIIAGRIPNASSEYREIIFSKYYANYLLNQLEYIENDFTKLLDAVSEQYKIVGIYDTHIEDYQVYQKMKDKIDDTGITNPDFNYRKYLLELDIYNSISPFTGKIITNYNLEIIKEKPYSTYFLKVNKIDEKSFIKLFNENDIYLSAYRYNKTSDFADTMKVYQNILLIVKIFIYLILILSSLFIINSLFIFYKKEFILFRAMGVSRKTLISSLALLLSIFSLSALILSSVLVHIGLKIINPQVSFHLFLTKLNIFQLDITSILIEILIIVGLNTLLIWRFNPVMKKSLSKLIKEINQ